MNYFINAGHHVHLEKQTFAQKPLVIFSTLHVGRLLALTNSLGFLSPHQATVTFDTFLNLLSNSNQARAKNAGLIGFIFAKKTFTHNGNDNNKAKFDYGAAWMSLTLQANMYGLYTHGIGGIDYPSIYNTLNISLNEYDIICGFALGEINDVETLPKTLQEKEKPSARKPLSKIWQAGIC